MSRESFVFVVGLIVFLTAFSGFLWDWKKMIFAVSGGLLMVLGYSLRRSSFLRSIEQSDGARRSDAFVERLHKDTKKNEPQFDDE